MKNIKTKRLYEILEENIENPKYPLHMPGHKRQFWDFNFEDFDFTEIKGLDNLQNPEECIDVTLKAISKLFNSNESLILVNGSTVGILASIMGLLKETETILIARNCHQSAINAITMAKCDYEFINPTLSKSGLVVDLNIIDIEKLIKKSLLQNKLIKAMIITSPTYEGVVMDIVKISKLCKKYNIVLIVDEAHGAHFIDDNLPTSSIELGADVVIQSLHKTLPAPTQTALMHFGFDFNERKNVKRYLNMLQTTSPSYFFMYCIDKLVENIESGNLDVLFKNHYNRIINFRANFKDIENYEVFELVGDNNVENSKVFDFDIYKLTFIVKKSSGSYIADILRNDYKIEVEMAQQSHIVCMTSIADNNNIFNVLLEALKEISIKLKDLEIKQTNIFNYTIEREKIKISDITYENMKLMVLDETEGQICGKNITPYPPCIPLLISGEIIKKEDIRTIGRLIEFGINVIGVEKIEDILYLWIYNK